MATASTSSEPTGYDTIPYATVFDFERPFFNRDHVILMNNWMRSNWRISITCAATYVCCTFVGRSLMRKKAPFDLRPVLVVWNLALAIFSLLGFLRVLPEFVHVLNHEGFEYSVCNNSNAYGVTGFWTYLFCLSKVPELFDTSFLVLRKRPLIFLHWFHHATVLVYAWYSYKDMAASGRWFVLINYGVHGFMYSYYALRALRVDVPRAVAMTITLSQIAQMLIGCMVSYSVWIFKRANRPCNVTANNIRYSFVMYTVYLVLFAHFFMQAYILKKKPAAQKAQELTRATRAKPDKDEEALTKRPAKHRLLSTKENGCVIDESSMRYRKLEIKE